MKQQGIIFPRIASQFAMYFQPLATHLFYETGKLVQSQTLKRMHGTESAKYFVKKTFKITLVSFQYPKSAYLNKIQSNFYQKINPGQIKIHYSGVLQSVFNSVLSYKPAIQL